MIITAEWTTDTNEFTFDFELDPGVTAFVDREWALRGQAVPALLIGPNDNVAWWNGHAVQHRRDEPADGGADPLGKAISIVRALAAASVSALPTDSRGAVEITGSGVVAHTMEAMLGGRPWTPPTNGQPPDLSSEPLAAVDTTGSAAVIMNVAQRLVDCATLVLAGPDTFEPNPVNLYEDVHRRSLRLVGIAPLPDDNVLRGISVDPPRVVQRGQSAGSALWYRLNGPAPPWFCRPRLCPEPTAIKFFTPGMGNLGGCPG